MNNDEEMQLTKNEEISLTESTSSQVNSYKSLPQELIEMKEVNLKEKHSKDIDEIFIEEETLFQNPISSPCSRKLGKTYAFYYINGRPLFIIGPDCN